MNSVRAWLAAISGAAALAAAIAIPASTTPGPALAPARLAPSRMAPGRAGQGRAGPGRVAAGRGGPGYRAPGQAGLAVTVADFAAPPGAAGRPALVPLPGFSARVMARVRCGAFTGTVQHGGDGSVLYPAFITVTGRVSSSCGAAVTARIGYELDFVHQGPFILGKAGPRQTATVRRLHRQTRLATSYQNIFVQVCTGARRLTCGTPVHV
jgi:hypothetical protein